MHSNEQTDRDSWKERPWVDAVHYFRNHYLGVIART
jgi:hypothetical protein